MLRGTHPDCVTAEDSQHKDLSVEVLRALRSDAYIQPNEGACKVFLFPDCRRLTVQDQNVLLKLVEEEQLSAGHARALLGAPTAELQRQAAKKVIADGLSVRQTEALVKALQREKKAPPKQAGDSLARWAGRSTSPTEAKKAGSSWNTTTARIWSFCWRLWSG